MNWSGGGPGLLDRTVAEISAQFRKFLIAGQIASRDGFLQNVVPVVKLGGVFVLVCLTVATRDPVLLAGFLLLSVGLALCSKIPLRRFVSQWVFVVAFSCVVVLPQLFLMDGRPLIEVFGLTISDAGVRYVTRFTLRVGAAVSLLSLVILTTRFSRVLGAFRRMRVPETLITLVAITYRYLLLFFAELNRMVLAQQSRTFERTSLRESWRRLGNLLGTFFLRTFERGERVQLAVRSRGGSQSLQPYEDTRTLTRHDYLFGVGVVGCTAIWVILRWTL